MGFTHAMPFALETALKQSAGNASLFEAAQPWGPKVVVSGKGGRLITGQNPASAGPIGEAIVRAIAP